MRADKALAKLIEGNRRYVQAQQKNDRADNTFQFLREQKPFAIILGCSDSRVPAELVFDQGLGDLFVIRVAGNIVAPSQIGSIEFACQHFGTALVVVLGHSHCGAIEVTLNSLLSGSDTLSPNLAAIVDRVTPAIQEVIKGHEDENREGLIHKAMKANIEQSVRILKMRSRIIRGLLRSNKLKIVGAEYSIETGEVHFYQN